MNIQDVKHTILSINRHYEDDINRQEAITLLQMANDSGKLADFPSKVSNTVLKSKRVSEKQAYVIARGIDESGLDLSGLEAVAKDALIAKALGK